MGLLGSSLPDFPWDSLEPAKDRARAHPEGIVDLSVGTPVDPTPEIARRALIEAADSPGYPPTIGTPELRGAIVAWFARRRGATVAAQEILPVIGSKEIVALLPALLGLGAGHTVAIPAVAYPTYDVGARLAGATPLASDDPADWPENTKLVWLNSPGNPHGHVLPAEHLREVIAWARAHGAVVAADECYAELPWAEPYASAGVPSLLNDEVCGGDHSGLLVTYSLSKQSSVAGYRAALLAGDASIIGPLREVRKHSGMMMPAPVQAAMTALLGDDSHVAEQKERYGRRRELLLEAVASAGLQADPQTAAGLYVWAHADAPSMAIVDALSERGILAAPGSFYGPEAEGYVRLALTASDEAIASAVKRLAEPLALS